MIVLLSDALAYTMHRNWSLVPQMIKNVCNMSRLYFL